MSIRKLSKRVKEAEFLIRWTVHVENWVIWVCLAIPATLIDIVQNLTNPIMFVGKGMWYRIIQNRIQVSINDNFSLLFSKNAEYARWFFCEVPCIEIWAKKWHLEPRVLFPERRQIIIWPPLRVIWVLAKNILKWNLIREKARLLWKNWKCLFIPLLTSKMNVNLCQLNWITLWALSESACRISDILSS